MNNARRLGLLTIVTTMIAMPLATGIAGAEPEAPPTEAVAPTDEAQLPDEFTSQYYNGENSSVAEFPFIIAGLRTPGARDCLRIGVFGSDTPDWFRRDGHSE